MQENLPEIIKDILIEHIFIYTGSRVYGFPTEDSDIDIVIRCTVQEALWYVDKSDNKCIPIMYGKFNIIPADSDKLYESFFKARLECLDEAPITRDKAKEIHLKWRKHFNVVFFYGEHNA